MKLKKNKRELILIESAKLFSEKGYSATSMKDIADVLEIEAASLYNHISSKQEILGVLLLEISNKFHSVGMDVEDSSYTSKEKLKELIKMHIRIVAENPQVSQLILRDWKHLKEPYLVEYVEMRQAYLSIFTRVVGESISSKELKAADPSITLNFILSSLRWIYDSQIYDYNKELNIVEVEKTIMDFVFNGIDHK